MEDIEFLVECKINAQHLSCASKRESVNDVSHVCELYIILYITVAIWTFTSLGPAWSLWALAANLKEVAIWCLFSATITHQRSHILADSFSLVNSAGLCPATNFGLFKKINPRIGNYGEFQFWEYSFDTVTCTGTIPVTVPSCTVVLYF